MNYKPSIDEIQSLKNIKLMMEIYDRRRYRPLIRDEVAILRSLVKDFMRKIEKGDVWEIKESEYEMLDEFLRGRMENEARSMLFATETILYLMHHNNRSIDIYLGRGSDEISVSARMVQEALNLQRGGYGEIEPGEGEILLELWIDELQRRRLT